MTTKATKIKPVYIRVEDNLHRVLLAESRQQRRSLSAHCAMLLEQHAKSISSPARVRGGGQ